MTIGTLNATIGYVLGTLRTGERIGIPAAMLYSDARLLLSYANRHPNPNVRRIAFRIMNKFRLAFLRSVAA